MKRKITDFIDAAIFFIFGLVIMIVSLITGADLAISILGGLLALVGILSGVCTVLEGKSKKEKKKNKKQ